MEQPASTTTYYLSNPDSFKYKALNWARQSDCFSYLDSNQYPHDPHRQYDALIGIGAHEELHLTGQSDPFEQLKSFYKRYPGWLFGFFTYDLKNYLEKLTSHNPDHLRLPLLHFFRPRIVLQVCDHELSISGEAADEIYRQIECQPLPDPPDPSLPTRIRHKIPKQQYLDTVERIRQNIIEGDVYELNFCQEFFAESVDLDPVDVFIRLNRQTSAPFACLYRLNDKYLLCSSPERFLKKSGNRLISQPIKGTMRRGQTPEEDEAVKQALANSEKDKAENIMIVDLVRNDLAKSAIPGTVAVDELFGIYTFRAVHQMISTISAQMRPDIHVVDAIKNAFPMGSMTGAPKPMAMQLIEAYEATKRGLFSGAAGYFSPEGDFDFNVVIRSMLYNQTNGYLSFQTGGAITFDSDPEAEYEESLLKADALIKALQG